jgi:flavin reductase (DIM6/NTAB) family NADH-FMN oxidoreductase RutF
MTFQKTAQFQNAMPLKHHSLRTVESRLNDGEASAEAIDMRASESITDDEFKTVMRQVVSSVAIVTARSGKTRNGLTATAVCSVSAEPPMMLVCVNRRATAENLIAESGAFAINVLTEDQHPIARLFSTSKLGADERFGEGNWVSLVTGAPVLDGAAAAFDCQVQERIVSGTHHVYIGRVVAAASLDQHALLYRDGLFRKLAAVS